MVKNFLLQIEQIEPNCDHEQKSNTFYVKTKNISLIHNVFNLKA